MKNKLIQSISRREALILGGKFISIGSTLTLLSCGQRNSFQSHSSDKNDSNDSTSDGNVPEEVGSSSSGKWASGGTDLITVAYPDDSIFIDSDACTMAVSEALTLGPCYFADTTGEDISLGLEGLPMQLCLRLVDSNCQPLQGYKIEIWHCDVQGIYSGDTSASSDSKSFSKSFCTGGNAAASASTWYRGMLTTSSNGRVNFKSCFPGWYSGRTAHIHFAISDSNNQRKLISQFCFSDDFTDNIYTTHSLYKGRGAQDTPLTRDGVFPSNFEHFIMNTQMNSDGTLLAYHTIQIK